MKAFRPGTAKPALSTTNGIGSNSLLLLLFAAMLLAAVGCNRRDSDQFAIISEDSAIATVNNAKIPLSVFQDEFNLFLQRYRQLIHSDEKRLDTVREFVIDRMINDELIMQEATRKGITVVPEELDNLIARSLAPYQNAKLSRILKGQDIDEIRWREKQTKMAVKEKLVQREVIDKIAVTKREIRKFYLENKNSLVAPRSYRVRNITLSTRKEAQAILKKLKRGESFVDLVREYSISPDKNSDGDLGYIEDGDLPTSLQRAIFKLRLGSAARRLSGIVEARDGFHIFKLLAVRKRRRLSQRQAASGIREILAEKKWNEAYASWIEKLRENAKITVDRAMLASEEGY